jgi:hypothetical protein
MTAFIVVFLSETNAKIAALSNHEISFQIIIYASLVIVSCLAICFRKKDRLKEEKKGKLFIFHGGKICALVFWVVSMCSLVGDYNCFERINCFLLQGKKVSKAIPLTGLGDL